jgi:NADP-reducing hydrogenase subunit HndA
MLLAAIDGLKCESGSLITILQKAQDIYGYLPLEVQKIIADRTGVPLEEIYGVATFYTQFSLNPKGAYTISCCLGTACYVKGAGDFFQKISDELGIGSGDCTPDGKFSLEACRCIGACGLAPVLTVNDDVYGRLSAEEVDHILTKYGASARDTRRLHTTPDTGELTDRRGI